MKFVEQTGVNWAAQQIKAVEMEIEQQKREWEEKRLAQLQQEEAERQKNEKEDNELLTYSREDALNKVNIKSSTKSNRKTAANNNINSNTKSNSNSSGNKRNNIVKSENVNQTKVPSPVRGKNSNSNGTPQQSRNGIVKKSPVKPAEDPLAPTPPKRNTRNTSKSVASESKVISSRIIPRRALSRRSDKSTSSILSKRTNTVRSTSESTRSTSMSRQTSSVPDDSDSECSLDVMIDSNDVNDSDSNSNAKVESNFDSTSQDDDTVLNDDSTITDETTIEKKNDKVTSSPQRSTRSRGTVKINLWSLDDSPIMPPKRQKISQKSNEYSQLKADFGVKECKVSMTDIHIKPMKPSPSQARIQKRLTSSAKNNHTLDSWVQKMPEPLNRSNSNKTTNDSENEEKPTKQITRTTRRNTNKTL